MVPTGRSRISLTRCPGRVTSVSRPHRHTGEGRRRWRHGHRPCKAVIQSAWDWVAFAVEPCVPLSRRKPEPTALASSAFPLICGRSRRMRANDREMGGWVPAFAEKGDKTMLNRDRLDYSCRPGCRRKDASVTSVRCEPLFKLGGRLRVGRLRELGRLRVTLDREPRARRRPGRARHGSRALGK